MLQDVSLSHQYLSNSGVVSIIEYVCDVLHPIPSHSIVFVFELSGLNVGGYLYCSSNSNSSSSSVGRVAVRSAGQHISTPTANQYYYWFPWRHLQLSLSTISWLLAQYGSYISLLLHSSFPFESGALALNDLAYSQGVGGFDKVAIDYGYRVFESDDEDPLLIKLVDDAESKGYTFLNDQVTLLSPFLPSPSPPPSLLLSSSLTPSILCNRPIILPAHKSCHNACLDLSSPPLQSMC